MGSVPPSVVKPPAPAPVAAKPAAPAPAKSATPAPAPLPKPAIKAPAPTGVVAAKVAAPAIKPPTAGARAVAGLFADSPIARSAAPEASNEGGGRSSFFPPAPAANGSTPPSKPSSRPPIGRSEQARQSGQFLAAAFAEGGLAEDTTAQARAAADAGTDALLDELFDEVVKTSEHPALPPRSTPPPAPPGRPSQPSGPPSSVDDMFAALNEEEGFADAPPAPAPVPRARTSSPGLQRASSPGSGSAPFPFEERTTTRNEVDDLFASPSPSAKRVSSVPPAPAEDRDYDGEFDHQDDGTEGFGEADLFGEGKAKTSAPPAPRLASDAPAAPPSLAGNWDEPETEQRSSKLPLIILLVLAALGGGGFFYYTKVMAPRAAAPAPAAPTAEPAPSAEPAAAPEAAAAAGAAAAAPEQAAAEAQPAAAPSAAAAEPARARPAPAAAEQAAPAREEAPAAAAQPASGPSVDIEISSLPRGADITVSGKVVGTTPVHVPFVIGKSADVRVSTAGYAAQTQTFVPTAGNEPLRFKLEPLPYALVVRSTPVAAEVSVGQRTALAPAPLELGHLDGGVQVSIAKDGYQRMTRLVRLDEFSEQNGVMRAEIEVTLSALPGGPPPAQRPHGPSRPRARGASDTPPAPSADSEPSEAPAPAPEAAPKPAAEAAPAEP
jgi:hypothetical protein